MCEYYKITNINADAQKWIMSSGRAAESLDPRLRGRCSGVGNLSLPIHGVEGLGFRV